MSLNINKLPDPSTYISQLSQLSDGKDLILDEFRKVYVISHTNPNNQEYQQQFANTSSQLDQVESKVFTLGNEVDSNIETMNQSLLDLNTQIEIERMRNAELKKKLGTVEQEYTSADGMIAEYKEYYNINYLRNWGLLLSIILCIYAITLIREPAKIGSRIFQNNFQQTALLSLIYNIIMFIPCLVRDLLGIIGSIFKFVFNAIAYIPCVLSGKTQ